MRRRLLNLVTALSLLLFVAVVVQGSYSGIFFSPQWGGGHWLAATLTSFLPLVWLMDLPNRRRARRQERGECPSCGYDLRATPGRCPECGWQNDRTRGGEAVTQAGRERAGASRD